MNSNRDAMSQLWKELLGIIVGSNRVDEHAKAIAKWSEQSPTNIRYMDSTALANLRREVFNALVAHGTSEHRATKLAASVRVGQPTPQPEASVIPVPEAEPNACDSPEKKTMPYLDKNNELVIPHDCPKKYQWWRGGQSTAETLIELY